MCHNLLQSSRDYASTLSKRLKWDCEFSQHLIVIILLELWGLTDLNLENRFFPSSQSLCSASASSLTQEAISSEKNPLLGRGDFSLVSLSFPSKWPLKKRILAQHPGHLLVFVSSFHLIKKWWSHHTSVTTAVASRSCFYLLVSETLEESLDLSARKRKNKSPLSLFLFSAQLPRTKQRLCLIHSFDGFSSSSPFWTRRSVYIL